MDLRKQQNNIVYSKRIKAGKRVYFFDIREDSKDKDIEKFYKAFEEVKNSLK